MDKRSRSTPCETRPREPRARRSAAMLPGLVLAIGVAVVLFRRAATTLPNFRRTPEHAGSPGPHVADIVRRVEEEMRAGMAKVDSSTQTVKPLRASRSHVPVLLREGDAWVSGSLPHAGPALAFDEGQGLRAAGDIQALQRRPDDVSSAPAPGGQFDAAGDIDWFEPKSFFALPCLRPRRRKTTQPDPQTCKIIRTTHPTHPDCNPDTYSHPLCSSVRRSLSLAPRRSLDPHSVTAYCLRLTHMRRPFARSRRFRWSSRSRILAASLFRSTTFRSTGSS